MSRSPYKYPLSVIADTTSAVDLPFSVQPLFNGRTRSVFGYEVLYAGDKPAKTELDWASIDTKLVSFLAQHHIGSTLFVNLSNETIRSIDESLIFRANERNEVFFEWSEYLIDDRQHAEVVRRLNTWSARGLRVVIDDWGSGRDGLQRICAINHVTAIKIDGDLFRLSARNNFAKAMIESLVRACTESGIVSVAESVETQEDFEAALNFGVDLAQGFYIDALCQSHFARKWDDEQMLMLGVK